MLKLQFTKGSTIISSINIFSKHKLKDINSCLLILIAFSIPLSVALPSLLTGVMVINWLLIASFKDDWNTIKTNKIVLAVFFFISIHIIALLWTNDIEHAFSYTLQKESRLLLIPFFMLYVQKRHIQYYFYAFILATTISEFASYSIIFGIIDPINGATASNPLIFLGHITYNPLLAIAAYLVLHSLLFSKELSKKKQAFYILFFSTMSINMFLTGGRAGQVMYLAMIVLILLQYFEKQKLKALLLSSVFLPLLVFTFYTTSANFKNRVDSAISDIEHFGDNRNTSVGLRINFALNSWELIKENPIFGTGTGSFRTNYARINQIHSKEVKQTINPHNMYTFELVELGLLGLIGLLSIFFTQIKYAVEMKENSLKNFALALPLLYLLIMLSESYLLIPSTTFLFSFFSAILYKIYNTQKVNQDVL